MKLGSINICFLVCIFGSWCSCKNVKMVFRVLCVSCGSLCVVGVRRRCCIVSPVKGWGSIATENGYVIIEPLSARPRYRVVYPEGVIVRSAADIDDSDFVRVIPKGEVVEGTGQVQMFDNVERIQVSLLTLWCFLGGRGGGVPHLVPSLFLFCSVRKIGYRVLNE